MGCGDRQITPNQAASALWLGGMRSQAHIAVLTAVAGAESCGWHLDAVGDNGTSFGPWQEHTMPGRERCARDLAFAGRYAVIKFHSQGFGAWSTYSSGAFRAYLGKGREAAAHVVKYGPVPLPGPLSRPQPAMGLDADGLFLVQLFPVPGASYSNDFGAPRSGGRHHEGNDLFAPLGTPILATTPGRYRRDPNTLGGKAFRIENGHGHVYGAHLADYALGDGAPVRLGQVVGYVDHTGDAIHTADHLHFEVHPRNGAAVNPFPYLNRVRAGGGGSDLTGTGFVGSLPVIPGPAKMVKGESAAELIRRSAIVARRTAEWTVPRTRRIRATISNWR